MPKPLNIRRNDLQLLSAPSTGLSGLLLAGMTTLLACLAPPAARANDTTLAPSATLTCLTLPPGAPPQPVYPVQLLERKNGGTLHVALLFTGPNKKPGFKVTGDETIEGFDQLAEVLQRHTEQYRLPCMSATDAPVTLRRDYVFDPLGPGKVMASAPVDATDAARRKQMACRTHIDGPDAKLRYPYLARLNAAEGKVLVRLRFTAPDSPPTVQIVAAPYSPSLRQTAIQFAQGYRVPCLENGPLELDQIFSFAIEGNGRLLLRDAPLKMLLGAAKSYPKPAFFDLTKMACPFELRITYKQPWGKNLVDELNQSNLERAPLMDWLSGIVLNLDEQDSLAVLGDRFNVSVPCGSIDL